MDITITAGENEWNALIALLDVAVKEKGLEVALQAGWWHQAIQQAAHNAVQAAQAPVLKVDPPKTEEVPPKEDIVKKTVDVLQNKDVPKEPTIDLVKKTAEVLMLKENIDPGEESPL